MAFEITSTVSEYGYAATFVGVLLEGESFLVLSGIAARAGYLDLRVLIALGTVGAMLTDNVFFGLGRLLGPAIFARFPRLANASARLHGLIERRPNAAVIIARFMYGTRSAGPTLIGSGRMAWSRFLMLDAVAALVWSVCWTNGGYWLGDAGLRLWRTFE
jgi:membrane protein DedA with SNARE-associated domain